MKQENIRESVSKHYAKAISSASPSCCGPGKAKHASQCCGTADLAGYTKQDISTKPLAAGSSFGCGNPLGHSDVKRGDVVLDLGSGAGFDLLIASEKVGPDGKVIGVDMTEAMLAAAQKNIDAAGATNIELRKGIIEQLPVDDSSVDWVISNCVVNLSPEKDRVFSEIYRVLKPGGHILISDMVVQDLPEEIRSLTPLYNSCVAGAISEEDYLDSLRRAGLNDVTVIDRLVYEPSQIKSFFDTDDVPGLKELFAGLDKKDRNKAIDNLLNVVNGKVWSAKFSARKDSE